MERGGWEGGWGRPEEKPACISVSKKKRKKLRLVFNVAGSKRRRGKEFEGNGKTASREG